MKTPIAAFAILATSALAACVEPAPAPEPGGSERPMDEVPTQTQTANGNRQYAFKGGCVIVIEANRAVVVSESASCQLYHRDIALLYAAGD